MYSLSGSTGRAVFLPALPLEPPGAPGAKLWLATLPPGRLAEVAGGGGALLIGLLPLPPPVPLAETGERCADPWSPLPPLAPPAGFIITYRRTNERDNRGEHVCWYGIKRGRGIQFLKGATLRTGPVVIE